jgi:NAD(P)H dehydrogenase (quinone)
MTISVTGASGHLGRLAVLALLERGVPAGDVVAVARDTAKVADLSALGVTVRRGDYDDPASLSEALSGTDRLVLVSGSELGQRVPQHRNVVEAAKQEGVGLIAYTSAPHADTSGLLLAAEHLATEQLIRESGVPFVLLRNSWYLENYTDQIGQHLDHGAVYGAAADGRISGAARRDYAEAAAVVVTEPGYEGSVHELGGDEAFTMAQYAAALSVASGTTVEYRDLPVEDFTALLVDVGLPEPVAGIYADSDAGIARGELHVDTGDLSRLIGRPTTTLEEGIKLALD